MRTANLLLVDDDDLDVEALERAIREARIANPIFRASDGEEALQMLNGEAGVTHVRSPVLVFLDLNMPRMTGLEFLQAIRAHPNDEIRRTVAFVLTTSDAEADRLAAYDAHVAGYIVKTNAGESFLDLSELIKSYWKLVELP